jgi:hypothetical protein
MEFLTYVRWEIILLLVPMMTFLNRLRGTGFEDYGIKTKVLQNGAPIAACILGLYFHIVYHDRMTVDVGIGWPLFGISVAIVYMLGESFGWGKWLQTIPFIMERRSQEDYNTSNVIRRDSGKDNGIHAIANAIFKEHKNYAGYAITALMIRALYWWVPFYLMLDVFIRTSELSSMLAILFLGITFPLSYMISYSISPKNYWARGEYIYGFCQGVALSFVLLIFLKDLTSLY